MTERSSIDANLEDLGKPIELCILLSHLALRNKKYRQETYLEVRCPKVNRQTDSICHL